MLAFLAALLFALPLHAAVYATPFDLTATDQLDPGRMCDEFQAALFAIEGIGDGFCLYPDNGAIFKNAHSPDFGTHRDAATYLPSGWGVTSYYAGNVPFRRRSNALIGHLRFAAWEHPNPANPATCPLENDISVCLDIPGTDECELDFARNYLANHIYPNPAQWAIRPMDTRFAGEAPGGNVQSRREWGGVLSITHPGALYSVVSLTIQEPRRSYTNEGVRWLLNGDDGDRYGAKRTVSTRALSCEGVAAGQPALVVDEAHIYTGESGQFWSEGCVLASAVHQGTGIVCSVGLGDGTTRIDGHQIFTQDGGQVELRDLHLGSALFPGLPAFPAPPQPWEIPPGEAAEVDTTLAWGDPGCVSDPAIRAQIIAFNPLWGGYCYHDTMHLREECLNPAGEEVVTHHGDGLRGSRHPSFPAECFNPDLSIRASGAMGHFYPLVFVPEPPRAVMLCFGVAVLLRLNAKRPLPG